MDICCHLLSTIEQEFRDIYTFIPNYYLFSQAIRRSLLRFQQ